MSSLQVQVFPRLKLFSMVMLLTLINLAVYTSCLCVGGVADTALLAVSQETLIMFGCKYPEKMREGEWWRFITPVFLHSNLMHILSNTIMFLLVG